MATPTTGQTTLADRLWNPNITPQNYGSSPDLYYTHALEQFKVYAQTAEEVSNRRGLTNTFFLTVQSILASAIAFAYEPGWHFQPRWLVILPLGAALLMCYFWWRLVKSYRQLNSAKFKVIEEYERRLPTAPFVEAEWKGVLGEGKDLKLYTELTSVEKWLPIVFAALFCFGALAITFF